jgi:hypothetical protein
MLGEDPMAKILGVHGIGQQLKGPNTLRDEWLPALRDGLALAGVNQLHEDDLSCAFYGCLFRRPGTMAVGDYPYDASDVDDAWEQELLMAWWAEAALIDPAVPPPNPPAKTMARTPRWAQRALDSLSHSRFFTGVAERAMVGDLKQVRAYMTDNDIRHKVCERVADAVSDDTRVLIGHSLGAVVVYEALCAHPEWPVTTFVSLGAPLGIRNLIFERLRPAPQDGMGAWPGAVERWVNVADAGDVVALVKDLRPQFGERVGNQLVHNGATAHNIRPYLTAKETGHAIAAGLGD